MRLYAITDRRLVAGSSAEQRAALLAQAGAWARAGVDWVQLREKDLDAAALEALAGGVVEAVRQAGRGTRVLLNGEAAVARAAGADGVHLPGSSEEIGPRVEQVRVLCGAEAVVSVACHTAAEVAAARTAGASLILFAPVFEKPLWGAAGRHQSAASPDRVLPGAGLQALAAACAAAADIPVYALGGVTPENSHACMEAGAAGVAGIRLFAGRGGGGWRKGEWMQLHSDT